MHHFKDLTKKKKKSTRWQIQVKSELSDKTQCSIKKTRSQFEFVT